MVDDCPEGWAHHGLALLPDRTVVAYHPGVRRLLFFDTDGELVRAAHCEAVEAHDITGSADGQGLWLADCGQKLCLVDGEIGSRPPVDEAIGQVLLVDLEGRTRRRFGPPDHPAYRDGGAFLPTGVALDERGLWIADGYGSDLVHLVDDDGALLLTIEGFDCPHGIAVDRRGPEPRLCIAERGRRRLAIHDLDGGFVDHVGVGDLLAPCAVATSGELLVVADLVSKVVVFDRHDRVVDTVGNDAGAVGRPGWPNARIDGALGPPSPEPGRFNSPHGVAADDDGCVVVTEWSLGGRWVRFHLDAPGPDSLVPMASKK
jgi:hypothetical protein